MESELFGHEKGAFTGATEARRGAFERAEGGTLFLDEVSDMPVRMQALLLRVLETGEVRPLGSPASRIVDCRIVCASRKPLADLVRHGKFREDLYFRINVIRIPVWVQPTYCAGLFRVWGTCDIVSLSIARLWQHATKSDHGSAAVWQPRLQRWMFLPPR